MCFRFLATLVVCGTQLGNYAVELFQMTLESAWIYEIHHFLLNFVSIYRKAMKSIAITYFLATLHILATKIVITRYLVIRGVCRISQGGGPNFKISRILDIHARSGMLRAAKLRAFARGVWGHAPPRKFLKMVQFRAF